MKVTFVYPDFFSYDEEHYMPEGRIYLGIGYLSAYLKREGHRTALLHLVRPPGREEFEERLAATSPDLVAFSSTTHLFPHVRRWSSWARRRLPGVPLVGGGAHATIDPEDALLSSSLDMVCLGEGEEALAELCVALQEGRDHRRIASFWVRDGEDIIRNPVRPLLEDLDSLPFPDRDIFDPADFCEQQHERGTLMASRGCPYNCSYCSNHAQKRVYPNPEKYVRFRSVDGVMREIHQIIERDVGGRLRYIRFDDDILTLDREWFRELARRYREEVDLPFVCNSRANLMDEESARLFAEAGCQVVCMGIESGNARLRREVLNRPMREQQIVRAFRLCREHGMKTVSTNMTGLPGEGVAELLDTVKLNARARPDCMQVSVFHPYPHTRLYEVCREKGLLTGRHVDTIFDGRSALDDPNFRDPAWQLAQRNFHAATELYSRLYDLGRAGERLAGLVDRLFAPGRWAWPLRERVLKKLLSWAGKRQRFDWIDY